MVTETFHHYTCLPSIFPPAGKTQGEIETQLEEISVQKKRIGGFM